jgi:hypothetical protein
MIKRAIPAFLAVALVGCSDNKSAIGRFQVHESTVVRYKGTKEDNGTLQGFDSHLLIKTDTATGQSWYWHSRTIDGNQTTDEWVPIGEGDPLGLNLGHK